MLARAGNPPTSRWAPDALQRSLLDAVAAPLAIIDANGSVVHTNAGWRALAERAAPYGDLGSLVSAGDHDGASYVRRLSNLEGPLAMAGRRLAHAIQDVVAGRSAEARVEYRMRRPTGEAPFVAVVAPLADGKLAVVQHLDQSDGEHAADAEAAALRLGLEAEVLRSRLRRLERSIVALGRDLHNPITPVRIELHLLESGALGPLSPEQARAVAIAARNAQRWADGEQSFQHLAAEGADPGHPEPFDLVDLARSVVGGRQTQALKQGVRLTFGSASAAPVQATAAAIVDVLDRYLDQAFEASPAGSAIAVEVTVSPDAGKAALTVRDSGPGLTARDLKAVFDPWAHRGSGAGDLSLHHARALAVAEGGDAWAESDGPGQGILLGLALPLLAHGGFDPDAKG